LEFFCLDNNDQGNQIGLNRPTWCIFGKQNQNVETLLFKGKFFDWPNDHQELKSSTDINKLPATQRVCCLFVFFFNKKFVIDLFSLYLLLKLSSQQMWIKCL
jgi:hypothetical protein